MGPVIDLALPIIILVVQYFLSKQARVWPGGILPAAFAVFFIWLMIDKDLAFFSRDVIPLILGITILCGVWINGQEAYKKKQEKELMKMRGQDLI